MVIVIGVVESVYNVLKYRGGMRENGVDSDKDEIGKTRWIRAGFTPISRAGRRE